MVAHKATGFNSIIDSLSANKIKRGYPGGITSQYHWSRRWDSNPRPADYESAALPLSYAGLGRMFHELLSRDREDGSATGQPQGATPEDARFPARRAYSSERRTAIPTVAASDSRNIWAKRRIAL
jgi:hypothetical protein